MKMTKIIDVTPENVQEETLFCIKDIKKPGFQSKRIWFEKQYLLGLRMKILKDNADKMIGFIEYIPVDLVRGARLQEMTLCLFTVCTYIPIKIKTRDMDHYL